MEQFSNESSGPYANGFALSPQNAILNFTINGLTPSTEAAVAFTNGSDVTISGNVTPNGSGTATFAVGLPHGTDLNDFTLTVGGNAIPLVNSSTLVTAGHIYNITRSAPPVSLIVNPAVGQVIGADGKNYADAATAEAAGTTAVAKICYVGSDNGEAAPYNHGLALAMSDAGAGNNIKWSTSSTKIHTYNPTSDSFSSESGLQYNDATHNSDTYPIFKAAIANNGIAVPTGCSAWFLASGYQFTKMFAGNAGNLKTLAGLESYYYWSSSEYDAYYAWVYNFGGDYWDNGEKGNEALVRSCLAF